MLKLKINKKYSVLKNKFKYVLDNFNYIYKTKEDINICYGIEHESQGVSIRSNNCALSFFNNRAPLPEKFTFIDWQDREIPIFFIPENNKNLIDVTSENRVVVYYDILSSAFYLLSSWQEWFSDKADEIGRFPAKEHFLVKHKLIDIPVVNYYFDILCTAIRLIYGNEIIEYKNKNMKSVLTHDIDRCETGWIENSYREFLNGHLIKGFNTLIKKIIGNDVWFNFDEMMAFEKAYNIKATYFFIPKKSRTGNIKNADYVIGTKKMMKVLEKLKKKNHEIGLHGSYKSGFQKTIFNHDIQSFPIKIKGNRFHFLAMKIPDTYYILEQSEIEYDTTLGFAESIGFRNGYCYPFKPYNIDKDKGFTFLEFPLMVMDRTLENYMSLEPNKSFNSGKKIIDEIEKFKGVFIMLWHNKSFSGFKYKKWRWVLSDIIKYCISNNSCFMKCNNFIKNKV